MQHQEDSYRTLKTTMAACKACQVFDDQRKYGVYKGPAVHRHTCKSGEADFELGGLESLEQENDYWRGVYREGLQRAWGIPRDLVPDVQQEYAYRRDKYRAEVESRSGEEKENYLRSIGRSARVNLANSRLKIEQAEKNYADQFRTGCRKINDNEEILSRVPSAEETISIRSTINDLKRGLSNREGQMFELVVCKGYPVVAAAVQLKITEECAYKIHSRMLKNLRQAYKDNDNDRHPPRRRR